MSEASRFLLARYGSWEEIGTEDLQLEYMSGSLSDCPEDTEEPEISRAECQLLTVTTISAFGLDWLLITVTPELEFLEGSNSMPLYLTHLPDIYTATRAARRTVIETSSDSDSAINRASLISLLVAFGWIIVSIFLAILASWALGQPLKELNRDMSRLTSLNFQQDPMKPSFIREVST